MWASALIEDIELATSRVANLSIGKNRDDEAFLMLDNYSESA
jgi:hypothetical protein